MSGWSLRKHKGSAACYSDVVNASGHPICCVHDDHAAVVAAAYQLFAAVRALIIQTSDWDIKDIQALGMETTLQMAREAMVKATSSAERGAS